MKKVPRPVKWFFLAFAVAAPFSPLFTKIETPDRMGFQWGYAFVAVLMASVMALLNSRMLRFSDDAKGGLTDRRTFEIVAYSFVITGCVGYATLLIVDRFYWHDHSIMFGLCILVGLSSLCATKMNKGLTKQ